MAIPRLPTGIPQVLRKKHRRNKKQGLDTSRDAQLVSLYQFHLKVARRREFKLDASLKSCLEINNAPAAYSVGAYETFDPINWKCE